MYYFALPLAKLVEELEKMPGIGPKSAQRLAFYILKLPEEELQKLVNAIKEVKSKIRQCSVCFNFTDRDPCQICADPKRDKSVICVVAEPRDVITMEGTGEYKGLYHVLGGLIDPLSGIGPDQLNIQPLIRRLQGEEISEVILATSPNVEGDATATYIAMLVKPLGIKATRIARGLPVGTDLDYADPATLIRALEGRREM